MDVLTEANKTERSPRIDRTLGDTVLVNDMVMDVLRGIGRSPPEDETTLICKH